MDDWDESDRAKVNPIVGQPGIAAGAGAVGVTVPRTTLASDDPAVTALQIMDDWDESDRAKVNPIAGQAGIAANSGAADALTPRVILATDDPAVAVLETVLNTPDSSFDSTIVNPYGLETVNTVNLNAVTSATNGTAVGTANYGRKTIYIEVTGNTGAVTVTIEHSPDGSTWYEYATPVTYTAANGKNSYECNDHAPYMRVTTTTQSSSTVTATITGRGQ